VRRVLGPLREAGFVRSHPGAHGGWELAAAPEKITLAQVWTLLQGDDPILGLHGPDPTCTVGRGVQKALTDLDRGLAGAFTSHLEQFTIADVISGQTTTPPPPPAAVRPRHLR
jgi:DNA-binding IscR family transcriptional regulator